MSAVAIDYILDGPHSVAAVVRGQSRLTGMVYYDRSGAHLATDNLSDVRKSFVGRPIVYFNATLGRAVEIYNKLPLANQFDDTLIMSHLLEQGLPSELAIGPDRTERMRLGRVRRIFQLYQQLHPRLGHEGLRHCYQKFEGHI